jgi:hypothetical protein
MNTGNYDQIVKFVSLDDSVDDYGGFPVVRTELLKTFASIKEIKSSTDNEQRERVLGSVFEARIKYRFSFEPTNLMHIEWSGYRYVINKIDLVGQRHKREYVMQIDKASKL